VLPAVLPEPVLPAVLPEPVLPAGSWPLVAGAAPRRAAWLRHHRAGLRRRA